MPRLPSLGTFPIVPCEKNAEFDAKVDEFAELLRSQSHTLLEGVSNEEIVSSGLFRAAVEKIRGQMSATMSGKRAFVEAVLNTLKSEHLIDDFAFSGTSDRHDYSVQVPGGTTTVFEAKGCLDGNNTTIFIRPPNADEFLIWSLCQNPGADPRHNVWSGIHTRLSAKIIRESQRVDSLIVWDPLCGTIARPCPKLAVDPARMQSFVGYTVPPPCIYLFPRTVPNARNNPTPTPWGLAQLPFTRMLFQRFGGREEELTAVHIEARIDGADTQRRTTLKRNGVSVYESSWASIRQAD